MMFYNYEAFLDYCQQTYNYEFICGQNEVLSALNKAQEEVLNMISYDCNYCFTCCCTEEIVTEAIYKFAYFDLAVYSADVDDNHKELQHTAYKFLKRHDCIRF